MISSLRQQLQQFSNTCCQPNALRWQPEFEEAAGKNVKIALLDSGIDWLHPTLAGANLLTKNFTGSGPMLDATGHGTQMAALLVGQGGLVPEAKLLFGKVLKAAPSKQTERYLASGIIWAVRQRVDLLVLPLGRARPSKVVSQALKRAIAQNIHVFAAAGNKGENRLLFPASLSGVISVTGAGTDGKRLPECTSSDRVDWITLGQVASPLSADGLNEAQLIGSSPATVIAAAIAAISLSKRLTAPTSEPYREYCPAPHRRLLEADDPARGFSSPFPA